MSVFNGLIQPIRYPFFNCLASRKESSKGECAGEYGNSSATGIAKQIAHYHVVLSDRYHRVYSLGVFPVTAEKVL